MYRCGPAVSTGYVLAGFNYNLRQGAARLTLIGLGCDTKLTTPGQALIMSRARQMAKASIRLGARFRHLKLRTQGT